MSVSGMSGSAGSLPMRWTTSARKPSTPRSSQKRSTSCIASTTSGLSQLRSGCWGRKGCRYHCSVASSHVHAGPPPKAAGQLLGGCVRRPVAPAVPVALGRVARRAALDEPRVLVGGVVGHPVEEHADVARVGVGEQRVEGREVAEERVDVAVVGHVVAEVGHRRAVDRRQPERVDARATAGGRGARAGPRGRRRRRRRRRRTSAGRSGRRRPPATTCGGEGYGPATDDAGRLGCRPWQTWHRSASSAPGSWARASRSRPRGPAWRSALYEPEAAAARALALVDRGLGRARGQARQAHRRRGRGAALARIEWSTDLDALAESELVVEAIVEDEEVKARTFKRPRRRRSAPRRSSRRTPRRSRSPGWRPPPGAPTASWGCTSSRRCRS